MIRHWRIVGKIQMSWYQLTIDTEALPAPGHRWSSRWPKRSETCDQRLLIIWGPTDPKWCKEFEFCSQGREENWWWKKILTGSDEYCGNICIFASVHTIAIDYMHPRNRNINMVFVSVRSGQAAWNGNLAQKFALPSWQVAIKDWVKSEIGSCSTYMYSWESSGGVEGLCNHFSGLISQRHRSSGLMIVNSSTFHGGRQKHEGRTRTCPPTCSDSCMDR